MKFSVNQCSWLSGIDCDGLNPADRARVAEIGLSAWMDEVTSLAVSKPARRSLEYKQSQMRLRKCIRKCLRLLPQKVPQTVANSEFMVSNT
jgi:hypothetical protein